MNDDLKVNAINEFIEEAGERSESFNEWWSIQSRDEQVKFLDMLYWYMNKGDYLVDIFNRQKELDKFIITNKASWVPSYRDKAVALIVEAVEMLENTNFKWWSNKNRFNRYKFIEEGSDVLHFLVSPLIDAGFTAKDFYEYYVDKNETNFKRAKGDY